VEKEGCCKRSAHHARVWPADWGGASGGEIDICSLLPDFMLTGGKKGGRKGEGTERGGK